MPQIVGSIGLCLDIAGVVLLFRYGLPEEISRSGSVGWLENEPERGRLAAKGKHYDRLGGLGLWLLIIGFMFQLVGNLMQLLPGW